ncbi:hypothetical protein [Uliginosibacterium gangwonense]|nr:hypothetical protein [Uliginosibacterium gangwonense]
MRQTPANQPDSFDIKAGKDIKDALKGLSSYSVKYQGAVDDPVP